MKYIYVSGPIGNDPGPNTLKALKAGDELLAKGYFPYIPHLSCFWDAISEKDYEDWMKLDMAWIKRCDAVLRLPGYSPGADREVDLAHSLGKTVYNDLKEVPGVG